MRGAVGDYRDDTIARRLREARAEAQAALSKEWAANVTPIKKRVLAERKAVAAVAAMYQQRLAKLNAELQRKLNPHRKRMLNLREEAQDVVREVIDGLALPERPRPEIVAPPTPALFDSRRSYFEQLAVYHKVSPPVSRTMREAEIAKRGKR